jgi:thioredoxin 1
MSSPGNLSHFSGSPKDLKDLVLKASGLVVLDFFATWCGPCKIVSSSLDHLASKHPTVKFLKADVDKEELLSNHYGIDTIPSVKFFKKVADKENEVEELGTVVGAHIPRISSLIEKWK